MALITEAEIADTILNLRKAGKRVPQPELAVADVRAEAQRILQETVDIFAKVFLPQRIGVERWRRAENIAITTSNIPGLNVNIITPALMQAALKQAEGEHVAESVLKAAKEKHSSLLNDPSVPDDCATLLRWTWLKLAERREIMPYMPTEEQFSTFCLKNNIAREMQYKYRPIIRAFLNDHNYELKHEGNFKTSKLKINRANGTLSLELVGNTASTAVNRATLNESLV